MRSDRPRSTPSVASASRTAALISALSSCVGATSRVRTRVPASSDSQASAAFRPQLVPGGPRARCCRAAPPPRPGSPSSTAATAPLSFGSLWRRISLISAVAMPAC